MKKTNTAILALEDGSVFYGTAIGHLGSTVGEVVFNTAMTGYQEVLTDPSYTKQIITFTYPSIGNTGVNEKDIESDTVQVAGLVIRNLTKITHHWRAEKSLDDYLKEKKVVGIADVDTRALTHLLRDKGALRGCIMSQASLSAEADGSKQEAIVREAISKANACPSLTGADLAKIVSTKKTYHWHEGNPWLMSHPSEASYKVVVYDYGVKYNILRCLVNYGCEPIVVPAQTPVEDVLALSPAGVVLSNGPGDPLACDYAIEAIKVLLEHAIPLLGICLGCQLLALACGAKTYKMKFGQHGINHPVQGVDEMINNGVMITSQNHGFAIDEKTLPPTLKPSFYALFDGTLQGIEHTIKPAIGFQGHPEASPGPHDMLWFFEQFMHRIVKSQEEK